MKPPMTLEFGEPITMIRQYIERLGKVFHAISFGDGTNRSEDQNTDTSFLNGTTDGVAGTEKAFDHLLERVPVGYIIFSKDKAAHLYNGATAFTTTKIYLKSDVASLTFKVILF